MDLHHKGDEAHLLREIVRTHQILMMGFSQKVGTPSSHFTLMRMLATSEHELGIMHIARQLGINAAAVTRLVKNMEAKGLVQRRSNPKDKRRSYIGLSKKGLTEFDRIHAKAHALELQFSGVISLREMEITADVLKRLRRFIEETMEGGPQ